MTSEAAGQAAAMPAPESSPLPASTTASLQRVAVIARNVTGARGAALALADDSGEIGCVASAGQGAPPVGATVDPASGIAGLCIRSREAQLCTDSETDPRVHPETCRELGVRSLLFVPVLKGEQVIGLMSVYAPEPGRFERRHIAALECLQIAIPALLAPPQPPPAAPPTEETTEHASDDPGAVSQEARTTRQPRPVPAPSFGYAPTSHPSRGRVIAAIVTLALLFGGLAWYYVRERRAATTNAALASPLSSPAAAVGSASATRTHAAVAPASDIAFVQDVHYIHLGEGRGRIIALMDRPVPFKGFRLANPERLYFDLYGARLDDDLKGEITTLADSGLRAIRTSQYQPQVVRLVLDVTRRYNYTASFAAGPARLIIDIAPAENQ